MVRPRFSDEELEIIHAALRLVTREQVEEYRNRLSTMTVIVDRLTFDRLRERLSVWFKE